VNAALAARVVALPVATMRCRRSRAAAGLAAVLAASLPALAQAEVPDASPAERLLFTQPHLANVQPPHTLRYAYVQEGGAGGPVRDVMTIELRPDPAGACCSVRGSFGSGPRALRLPEIEQATSNPALLYFLEREVRQMQQQTQGQAAHFRRRIRVTLAERATITPSTIRWRDREAAAQVVHIAPYVDDPFRQRFERIATKEYDFVMCDAVPGGLYQVLTQVPGTALRESLTLQETRDARSPAP